LQGGLELRVVVVGGGGLVVLAEVHLVGVAVLHPAGQRAGADVARGVVLVQVDEPEGTGGGAAAGAVQVEQVELRRPRAGRRCALQHRVLPVDRDRGDVAGASSPKGIAVDASPKLWMRSASNATLTVKA